jgi:hypothetical protein
MLVNGMVSCSSLQAPMAQIAPTHAVPVPPATEDQTQTAAYSVTRLTTHRTVSLAPATATQEEAIGEEELTGDDGRPGGGAGQQRHE